MAVGVDPATRIRPWYTSLCVGRCQRRHLAGCDSEVTTVCLIPPQLKNEAPNDLATNDVDFHCDAGSCFLFFPLHCCSPRSK